MRSSTETDELQVELGKRVEGTAREGAREQRYAHVLAKYGPSLARLAASYTNSKSDRDDLLQDIGMAIWRALPEFREECSERTYIFRIANNQAINHLSRRRLPAVTLEEGADIRDTRPTPEEDLASEQQRNLLLNAIRRLPVAFRQVITLTLEGMSYAQIAEVLGVEESNVGVRLSRARQILRKELEKK